MSGAPSPRLAVVGAGWSGLAAAVQATAAGQQVDVFEMGPRVGGRARSVERADGTVWDNGQHILIGAYTATLRMMDIVGADRAKLLARLPLELRYPDGSGLTLARGPALWSFTRGVLGAHGWSLADRLALLRTAARWWLGGMRNPGVDTVQALCAGLPARVREQLIEPLCVAALNTPASQASATVFLRVLNDALFDARGGADLLLPRANLSALFPRPAVDWLAARGCRVHTGHRVRSLRLDGTAWHLDDEPYAAVILACTPHEAARLAAPVAAAWAQQASALEYEPIATVYLRRSSRPLPAPMMALPASGEGPAQFVFDLDRLGVAPAALAFVVSGARPWLGQGLDALAQAVRAQARAALPTHVDLDSPGWLHAAAERRATFSCTPDLQRPPSVIAPGLLACGDYVRGPYPATLEGSVRSGVDAASQALTFVRSH